MDAHNYSLNVWDLSPYLFQVRGDGKRDLTLEPHDSLRSEAIDPSNELISLS